jgi:repressor of nif and glnA expression
MKRDEKLMLEILKALEGSETDCMGVIAIATTLKHDHDENMLHLIRHHLALLSDRFLTSRVENDSWRITDAGHNAIVNSMELPVDKFNALD